MMAKLSFSITVLLIICTGTAFAQVTLKGRIIDNTNSPIPGASIHIKKLPDSVRLEGAVSDAEGLFVIGKVPVKDTFLLEVTFIGYRPFSTRLYIKESAVLDSVVLVEDVTQLDDVTITGERPAVITRGDTVEYNAKSFETVPFAEARALVSQLPGLYRDQNGNLTFNGVKISKILVNGREYFGKDPLGTLPADVIEKIMVMNNPEPAPGTKPEDDKVLNIQLKKNARRFGNALLGAGSDRRYEAGGTLNTVGEKQQLGIHAHTNNTNGQGSLTMMGGGNGITQTAGGGVDYSRSVNKQVNVNAGLAYNNLYTYQESLRSRTQFLIPDSSFFTDANTGAHNRSNNVALRAGISVRKDTLTNYGFDLSGVSLSFSDTETTSDTRTLDSEGTQINRLQTHYTADGKSMNIPVAFRYAQRFSKYAHFNAGVSANVSRQTSEDFNLGSATFKDIAGQDSVTQIRQEIIKNNNTASFGINAACSFRLFGNLFLNVNDHFALRRGSNTTDAYTLDAEHERAGRDTIFSNDFRSFTVSNSTQLSAEYRKGKFSAAAGVYMNYFYSEQRDITRDSSVTQNQLNASPNIGISYRFSPQKNASFNYSAGVSPPTLSQLQPLRNNTNPLLIQQGNPDLKPMFSQNFSAGFQSYRESGTSINASVGFSPVRNKIIQSLRVDKSGKQISSYENVNGVFSLSGSAGFGMHRRKGFELKDAEDNTDVQQRKKRSFGLTANGSISYSRDKNFINGRLAVNQALNFSPSASANYNIGNNLGVTLAYGPAFTVTRYEYAASQNQSFVIHNLTTGLDLYVFKKVIFRNFIGLTHNGSLPDDFTKTTTFWNFELAYVLWKRAELKLRMYDVLKQNQNISRVASQNYIESTQSNNLQQYFMLTFKYHIR